MEVIEKDGLYQYIDENGNIYVLYPVTKLSNVTGTGKLIQFTDGKTLKTLDGTNIAFVTAKDIEGFATMKALEDLETLVGKANAEIALLKGPLNSHEDRITNLEQKLDFTAFVTDDSVAYAKVVPANALPYVEVNKIGGMTRKCANLFDKSKLTAGWLLTDGSVGVSEGGYYVSDFIHVNPDTTYYKGETGSSRTKFYDINKQSFTDSWDVASSAQSFKTPSEAMFIRITVIGTYADTFMLNPGNTALPYEPYFEGLRSAEVTEIENVGVNLTTAYPIPEAVKAIDGYGWGINESVYNYVDFENRQFVKRVGCVDFGTLSVEKHNTEKGTLFRFVVGDIKKITHSFIMPNILCAPYKSVEQGNRTNGTICQPIAVGAVDIIDNSYSDAKTFKAAMSGVMLYYELAEPIITDISDILHDGNYIEVESGGSITMVNEHQYDVPSEITYQVKRVMT